MSLSPPPGGTPVWWDARIDSWLIALPVGVPAFNREAVCDWMIRTQEQRRRGLVAGDLRDGLDRSMAALQKYRMVRAVRPGGGVVFQDWLRLRPDRSFHYAAMSRSARLLPLTDPVKGVLDGCRN